MFNFRDDKILLGNNPKLRKKSKKIYHPQDNKIATLIKRMIHCLKLNHGIGLAAPQIGKNLRLFIVELDYNLYVMINPTITKLSKNLETMEEGCLSFPGIFRPIKRSASLTVKYMDEKGEEKKLKASGLLARAIQHEYDHLEGILFVDRL